jgi:hypothetical protein
MFQLRPIRDSKHICPLQDGVIGMMSSLLINVLMAVETVSLAVSRCLFVEFSEWKVTVS